MLCDACRKNDSSVHLTQIINNNIHELDLCEQCANEMGLKGLLLSLAVMPDLIKNIKDKKDTAKDVKCKSCGISYREFKVSGHLGCSNCYVSFREQLVPLLKGIHGNIEHMGKVPLRLNRKLRARSQVLSMQKQMQQAIEKEEYEKAAEIRDKIKAIEKGENP